MKEHEFLRCTRPRVHLIQHSVSSRDQTNVARSFQARLDYHNFSLFLVLNSCSHSRHFVGPRKTQFCYSPPPTPALVRKQQSKGFCFWKISYNSMGHNLLFIFKFFKIKYILHCKKYKIMAKDHNCMAEYMLMAVEIAFLFKQKGTTKMEITTQ